MGINPRAEDLDINVTREKKLTNMRSSTADVIETLAKPIELDLEQAMEFCADDECVEVTPAGRPGAQGRAGRHFSRARGHGRGPRRAASRSSPERPRLVGGANRPRRYHI